MSVLQSIILAILEGLTEFLPVSSTGHLILASSLMGIASDPFTKAFTIAIQFGAILSVVVLYWRKFLPAKKDIIPFYTKLLLAFLPAGVFGLLFNKVVDRLLESVPVVAILLILGGVAFLFVDSIFSKSEMAGDSEPSFMSAFIIGLFQTLAMAPGVSRSAATIIGGLTRGLTRTAAAEFSFFLAVPTMCAATVYKLFKFYQEGNSFGTQELTLLAVGNGVAFLVALIAIRTFIRYLTRHGFRLFGYYRIALGALFLLLYYSGAGLSIL